VSDRTRELLDFDVVVLDALAAGHRSSWVGKGDARPPDLPPVRPSGGLVGFDEAGRGALAGPVAVGCVHIDLAAAAAPGVVRDGILRALAGVDDSKRLTPRGRSAARARLAPAAICGVGYASAAEVDRLGIVDACRVAARRAYRTVVGQRVGGQGFAAALFDCGLSLPEEEAVGLSALSFPHGDARSLHIAAASIVAKVGRDAILGCLARRFPGYGFSKHKGYGTAAHYESIRRLGASAVHRRSFLGRIEATESQSH